MQSDRSPGHAPIGPDRRQFLAGAAGFACPWLIPARGGLAAGDRSLDEPLPLGWLEPFWRHTAALGPYLEQGHGLIEIPAPMQRGDFPYRGRDAPREAPFADHLSIVRPLGGYPGGDKGRDLAYRDGNGQVQYRLELLRQRLTPYREVGYREFTFVLDNVPWCFPDSPHEGGLGQVAPPADLEEWRAFIERVTQELVDILGEDAQRLRFRVGTEMNGTRRFDGSEAKYFRHYRASVEAVHAVLPEAPVGPYNISGASVRGIAEGHNVNSFALGRYAARHGLTFPWVAFSRYFSVGADPVERGYGCWDIWNAFEQRTPLAGLSREVHEYGVAPFGQKDRFVSAEPGALGAALECQMSWKLRRAGLDRLWHWSVFDKFRDREGKLRRLPTGQAWLYSVMDAMVGGRSYLLPPAERADDGTRHLAAISFKDEKALLLASAYNPTIERHASHRVRFRLPETSLKLADLEARICRLNRETAVHDRIRRDLAEADLLKEAYRQRPDRLGRLREMTTGDDGEHLVGERWDGYADRWAASLTLEPITEDAGRLEADAEEPYLELTLETPEVVAVELA